MDGQDEAGILVLMPRFQLRTPIAATRYAHGRNEEEVVELLNGSSSRALNFSTGHVSGQLHVYGGEVNLYIEAGHWVVCVEGWPLMLAPADFDRLFVPAGV